MSSNTNTKQSFLSIITNFRDEKFYLFWTLVITVIFFGIINYINAKEQAKLTKVSIINDSNENYEQKMPRLSIVEGSERINMSDSSISIEIQNKGEKEEFFTGVSIYNTTIYLSSKFSEDTTINWEYPESIKKDETKTITGSFYGITRSASGELQIRCTFKNKNQTIEHERDCEVEGRRSYPINLQPYLNLNILLNDVTFQGKDCSNKCDSIDLANLESTLSKKGSKIASVQAPGKMNDNNSAFESENICPLARWSGESIVILYYNETRYTYDDSFIKNIEQDIKSTYPHIDEVIFKSFNDLNNPDDCLKKIQDLVGDCTSTKHTDKPSCGGPKQTQFNEVYREYNRGKHFQFTKSLVKEDLDFYVLIPGSKKMTKNP